MVVYNCFGPRAVVAVDPTLCLVGISRRWSAWEFVSPGLFFGWHNQRRFSQIRGTGIRNSQKSDESCDSNSLKHCTVPEPLFNHHSQASCSQKGKNCQIVTRLALSLPM